MKTHVEFRSDRFPAYPDEDELINPGLFGKRLAEFLATGLRSHGFEPLAPSGEDWGWFVPIRNDGFTLAIGCSNHACESDSFLCFIEPHTPSLRRFPNLFRKIDTRPRVEALRRAMDLVLSESEGIREKKWWTYEEFNTA